MQKVTRPSNSSSSNSPGSLVLNEHAKTLFRDHSQAIYRRTDKLFAGLLLFQWLIGIAVACWVSPLAWEGATSQVHLHVWVALFLGGAIMAYPLLLAFTHPGSALTRYTIAIAQMLFSTLFIHLTGGRVETHFHIFGSLAFLAIYRDWRVLLLASAVTASDHILRGLLFPQSIYGVLVPGSWRWIEHTGWVVFEDVFLFISIAQSKHGMQQIALRQAQLEATNASVEATIVARTAELRASEQRTRESQERYEVAVAGSNGGIWDWNMLSGSVYFSLRFKEMLGFKEEEFENRHASFMERAHPDDTDFMKTALEAHLRGETPYLSHDFRLRHKNGEYRWFHARGKALRDAQGQPYRMAGSITDITDRKLLETQLVHAQKMESIGQLAAGVAHEINTPIQYIGDNLRFLQEGCQALQTLHQTYTDLIATAQEKAAPQTSESEEKDGLTVANTEATTDVPRTVACVLAALAAQVQTAADEADLAYLAEEMPCAFTQSLEGVERVANIVRAMKEFSHPGAKDKTPTDLNHALESTLTVARNEWKYAADLVMDFAPDLPRVPCLPGDVNQVFLNLIVNAAHAIGDVVGGSGNKGVITVSTRQAGEWVEVRITDSGTGIPEGARSRLFDPFFTTKEVGKGTGQGLAIAHAIIVEKHGGTIHFETHMGKGTTFIVRLPLHIQPTKRPENTYNEEYPNEEYPEEDPSVSLAA